jgi:hypothetical protein
MNTYWDWLTLLSFAALTTLLLQRSSQEQPSDKLWQYAPPAAACAVANYVGNEGYAVIAGAILLAGAAYVYFVLFPRK